MEIREDSLKVMRFNWSLRDGAIPFFGLYILNITLISSSGGQLSVTLSCLVDVTHLGLRRMHGQTHLFL